MSDAMITRRGGGVNLNFRITQYNVDTDLSNIVGKPNEIAVLTNTKLADWTFSMKEPVLPTTGSLWIKTATASRNTVEVLKKNSIIQYMHGAFQYETGAWVKKKAYIYQNGKWNDFDIFLFDNGDQCTESTGGWVVKNDTNGHAAIGQAYITLSGVGSSNGNYAYSANKVNLSGYTKLKARMNVTSYGDANSTRIWLGLFSTNTSYSAKYVIGIAIEQKIGEQTLELDISNYKDSEDYYVGIRNNTSAASVYEVWLE